MALAYVAALRNSRMDQITSAVGASGLLRFYDGTRPATGGAATVLLATLTCSATFAPAASGGVLTLNAITGANAVATGTVTWARLATSGGAAQVDLSVAASGSDLNITSTAFVTGQPVAVSSFIVTEGNP